MKWLLILSLLLDPHYLAVVPSRDTVYPGQVFSVTITQFNVEAPVEFYAGSFEVLTDTLGLPTRYVWLRAAGPPRDVRVRATAQGISSEAIVRVCCKAAPDALNPGLRLWLAVFRA